MRHTLYLAIYLFAILSVACSHDDSNNTLVAKVDEHVLTKKEVIAAMPANLTGEDSIQFVKRYTDNWVRSKVIFEKAYSNIRDKDGAIEAQVQKFREDLYITKYEQLFSEQKLDTLIPQSEVDEYYKQYKNDFILKYDVIKPIFIVLPKEKDIKKVKKILQSNDEDLLDNIKEYCFEHSTKFYFGNQWVMLDHLKQEIPIAIAANQDFSPNKLLILEDSTDVYFIKVSNFVKSGEAKPKELAYEEIATILLHKRKIELLKNMRNKVYQDALHKKQFEVYY